MRQSNNYSTALRNIDKNTHLDDSYSIDSDDDDTEDVNDSNSNSNNNSNNNNNHNRKQLMSKAQEQRRQRRRQLNKKQDHPSTPTSIASASSTTASVSASASVASSSVHVLTESQLQSPARKQLHVTHNTHSTHTTHAHSPVMTHVNSPILRKTSTSAFASASASATSTNMPSDASPRRNSHKMWKQLALAADNRVNTVHTVNTHTNAHAHTKQTAGEISLQPRRNINHIDPNTSRSDRYISAQPSGEGEWSDDDMDMSMDMSMDMDMDMSMDNENIKDRVERRRNLSRVRKNIEARKRGVNANANANVTPDSPSSRISRISSSTSASASASHSNSRYHDDSYYRNSSRNMNINTSSKAFSRTYPENSSSDNPTPILSKASSNLSSGSNSNLRVSSRHSQQHPHQHPHQHQHQHQHNPHSHNHYSSTKNSQHYPTSTSTSTTTFDSHHHHNHYIQTHPSHHHPHHHPHHPSHHPDDQTTTTDGSGSVRRSRYKAFDHSNHYHHHQNHNNNEEYLDYDDETTVFDGNTVHQEDDDNGVEEEEQEPPHIPHQHPTHLHHSNHSNNPHHLNSHPAHSDLNSHHDPHRLIRQGYSSLGGKDPHNNMRHSLSSSTHTTLNTGNSITNHISHDNHPNNNNTKNNNNNNIFTTTHAQNGRDTSRHPSIVPAPLSSSSNSHLHGVNNPHHPSNNNITNIHATSSDSEEATQFTSQSQTNNPNSIQHNHSGASGSVFTSDTQTQTNEMNHPHTDSSSSEQQQYKMAAGLTAAAAVGAIVIGPVGLLIGAASLGLVGGYYQIPASQRNKVNDTAQKTLERATNQALKTSDLLSHSCATAFEKTTGMDVNAIPIPKGMECYKEQPDDYTEDGKTMKKHNPNGQDNHVAVRRPSWLVNHQSQADDPHKEKAKILDGTHHHSYSDLQRGGDKEDPDIAGGGIGAAGENEAAEGLLSNLGMIGGGGMNMNMNMDGIGMGGGGEEEEDDPTNQRRKVACLRKSRITPIGQIHALKPTLQPRAWLDVMASGLTSMDEKNEAMEEILILVKDKDHAQFFLDEGILDSLMYILSTSFQKLPPPSPEEDHPSTSNSNSVSSPIRNRPPPHNHHHKEYEIFVHAKLAANCCVALGKAHCAVVHTEGDLLLMSAYNRGLVPVERQLAQMLHEIPHHSRMLGTGYVKGKGGGVGVGGDVGYAEHDMELDEEEDDDLMNEDASQTHEEFMLTEMTMQQAEEMAKNIKALMEGRLDWT